MPKASLWINYLLMIPCAYVAQVLLFRFGWHHHSFTRAMKDTASIEVVVITVLIFFGRLIYLGSTARKSKATTA
jgi:hypothetical protein